MKYKLLDEGLHWDLSIKIYEVSQWNYDLKKYEGLKPYLMVRLFNGKIMVKEFFVSAEKLLSKLNKIDVTSLGPK